MRTFAFWRLYGQKSTRKSPILTKLAILGYKIKKRTKNGRKNIYLFSQNIPIIASLNQVWAYYDIFVLKYSCFSDNPSYHFASISSHFPYHVIHKNCAKPEKIKWPPFRKKIDSVKSVVLEK